MMKIKDNYLKDSKGHPVGIFLEIKEYRKLLKDLEELDSIRAYNLAKYSKDETVSFDQAVKEIEHKRR